MARTDYAANCGSQNKNEMDAGPPNLASGDSPTWPWGIIEGGNNPTFNGVVYLRSQVKFADIGRGLTNVIMFGEKHVNNTKYVPTAQSGSDPGDNEGMYVGCDNDILRCTWDPPLKDTNQDLTTRFGSAHVSGCNMAFSDGSVRMVEYEINYRVFFLMGDRSGNKIAANR